MTVPGVDISKWQGKIDWDKCASKGVKFAIIRAGSIDNYSGECYTDTQFERNALLAPPLMTVGFYWYFRPNWNATKQAAYFYDLIKDKDWDIYPVIDIEEYAGMSKQGVHDALWLFQEQLTARTGKPTMIYSNPSFMYTRVLFNSWMHTLPLWVAHWNVDAPYIPAQWRQFGVDHTFWQTHVGRDGLDYGMESVGLDHDVYNGTYEQFEQEFGLQPPAPPVPGPCPQIDKVVVYWDDGVKQEFWP